MHKFLDVQIPWFIPVWRRVVTVVACLGWAVVELAWGNPFWTILFGALGLYCAHQFFIAFDPKMPDEKDDSYAGASPTRHTGAAHDPSSPQARRNHRTGAQRHDRQREDPGQP